MNNLSETDNIYQKNIAALSQSYENEYDILMQHPEDIKEDGVHAFIECINGRNVLKAEKDGQVFQLESMYDSGAYLNKWMEYIKGKANISSKLIMFGIGNGMYIRKYLSEMAEDHEIIIYEPLVSVFKTVINHYDISDIILNKRVHLYFDGLGYDKDFGGFVNNRIKYQDVSTVDIYVYENYNYLYKDRLVNFVEETDRSLLTMMLDSRFLEEDGQLINDNLEHNIVPFIETKSMMSLKGKGRGIPAIVVGAGPSLDKNIGILKRAEGKAFILTTDSALRTLQRNNIKSDCIVTLDPCKDDSYYTEGSPEGAYLVTTLHSGWRLVDAHKGPYLFINSMDKLTNQYTVDRNFFIQSLKSGGSVAHVAFSMAQHLECSPIIFVGMDLAYPNNNSHCADSVVASVTVEKLRADYTVLDVHGNEVSTSADMLRYKKWIEREIEKYPQTLYIDATEGGALIEGTKIATLEETINEYCGQAYDIPGILDGADTIFAEDAKDDFVNYLSKVPENMRENQKKAAQLEKMYERMLEIIKKGKLDDHELIELKKKTNQILNEIETDSTADFTDNIVQGTRNRLFKDINIVKGDEQVDLLDTITVALEYSKALIEAINTALPNADGMVEKLKSRNRGV